MSGFKENPIFKLIYSTEVISKITIINECASFFIKHREVGAVYLCGSYAKGYANPYSDIDLLFFFNKGIKYRRHLRNDCQFKCFWWSKIMPLQFKLNKPIDLFDGDLLIHNGNYISGAIFDLMDKSELVYQKQGFIIPDITTIHNDYKQFRKDIESLWTSCEKSRKRKR